jgi:hypothetical protein
LDVAEHGDNPGRLAEVGHGVGDRVVIAHPQQAIELRRVELLDAYADLALQHEGDERVSNRAFLAAPVERRYGKTCVKSEPIRTRPSPCGTLCLKVCFLN